GGSDSNKAKISTVAERDTIENERGQTRPMSEEHLREPGASDPRLAAHANGPLPAWLWLADGTRILWANSAGIEVFGAHDGAQLSEGVFGPADSHRRQIAQLARRLNPNGAVRMERLRGFGAASGALATCSCSRIDFPDGRHGVLVVSAVRVVRRNNPLEAAPVLPSSAIRQTVAPTRA